MSFQLIEKQVLYTGKKVRLEIHRLENQETGQRTQREICVHPGAVVVLPLLPDGKVVLIRQRRYAIGQVLTELPAGTLEKGEDPMNCAGRELLEETGLVAGRLKPLCSFFSSPGILTEKMYVFAAYDLEQSVSALEEGEDIELTPVPLAEAVQMCGDGRIADGKSIAALLMFDRFHQPNRRPVAAATQSKTDGGRDVLTVRDNK
jgi:ADP-ribose pyrophosphatase